ncbi:Gfo/Idh/MocA family protein [Candidatus Halobonum tyrrellensis]|uniref:Oxidoreductase domain-containing protein n=1 Tax=Candidatus Halobonum tyrrellensis G22 TaxID=1324957 RepID=V4J3N1_9EURY|nr:Gfo/Idh/MocA family oxidoreductase [Candidatus Halobonum tyrrellensis]ESP89992.1 oxidoreductase domain-containing protein [Candidatus Halobonum tyrrellensis G22]
MTQRLIQVGTGNQGETWCREFLPPNVADGTVEVVAAVDVNPDALDNAVEHLDLDESRCYTDAGTAMAERDADAVALVVPPSFREELVETALSHDLDILSEKPLSDSMAGALRIVDRVETAGAKMGVTMSHRFRRDVTSLRRRIEAGEAGPVDYLHGRYAVNARSRGSWAGERLYDLDEHPLLVDGAVHHLDLLADMAGERAETVFCRAWNPPYSEFAGDPNAVVQVTMENGTAVAYEGLNTAAATFNGWGAEGVRANGRDATFVLDGGDLRRFDYDPDAEGCLGSARFEDGDPVELDDGDKWGNARLIERFADWCAGGEPMATNARDNLQAMALVFAAIESAETGESVRVQEFLDARREAVSAAD